MLKILQARLQQYVNCELPNVQTGFRKGRGIRDQIASIRWIIKKNLLLLPPSIFPSNRVFSNESALCIRWPKDWPGDLPNPGIKLASLSSPALAGDSCVMEKALAPHSSTLAWKIPWMEEPGRLQSMGS